MRIMSPSTRSGNEEMSVKSESLKSLNRETNISTNECKSFSRVFTRCFTQASKIHA